MKRLLPVLLIVFLLAPLHCVPDRPDKNEAFHPIPGFSAEANRRLESFLLRTETEPGRKVAVFDGDGTVLGQVPHWDYEEG